MRRATSCVPVLLLLVVAAACSTEPAGGDDRVHKVLIIGIDGVRPDILAEVPTPNIDALAADGTFSDRAQTGRPTMSGPGWSSLLIGVWPAKHGVTNNDFTNKHYDAYPDLLTRIEQVQPALNTFAALDWLPLGADSAGGPVIGDAPDRKFVVNGYALGWAAADSAVVDAAVRELSDGNPDASFVYLGNPDEVSHETKSIGDEYHAAIALADRHVGMLIQAVRQRPAYANEDWLVLVSTDHGRRADGGHGGDSVEESTIFYIASGPSTVKGTPAEPPHIVDVAVTALTHLRIEIDTAWHLDGKAVGLKQQPGGR
jgi:predicted AlkP superfamily pyrophosphatase or phosphodiesterase